MDWSNVSDTEGEDGLPVEIVVVKAMVYSVEEALVALQKHGEYPHPDMVDVMAIIATWASEDFGCKWGHPADPSALSFMDENGNVIDITGDPE